MNDSMTPMNERNEWRTPEALVNYCASLVDGFDYDTACLPHNTIAEPVWLSSGQRDAFSVEWMGRCFCNPPYDNIDTWIDKAFASTYATIVMVLPSPNGEKRYGRLLGLAFEFHIIGRVSFIGTDGKPKTGNPRGTSIFVLNRNRPLIGRTVVRREDMTGSWKKPARWWTLPCS